VRPARFYSLRQNFWLGAYHIDGLRLDAISRIIYWQGDEARGENGNAMSFIRRLTSGARSLNPGALMIAETQRTTAAPHGPVEQGGLGFDYKWDMGWITIPWTSSKQGLCGVQKTLTNYLFR
jgi:1,4-alpha-glucan branching enzyme